ncbi:MAG: metallophosphoesterase family protein [bacterium]
MKQSLWKHLSFSFWFGLFLLVSVFAFGQASVKEVMDDVVTRMYATMSEEALSNLDDQAILNFITEEEREVFAGKYWYFDTNVPIIVSIIRNVDQAVVPFWLGETGFKKTDLVVKNSENWLYEVWQKAFDAGRVQLGINGFDQHTTPYFVGVGAQDPSADLRLTNFYPDNQAGFDLREGAFIYHDWDELVLTEVPKELIGNRLLTTIRGRAFEAHLIRAFRETPFPSSAEPDQVVLTWSEDPRTTQTIQWRFNSTVTDGVIRYREKTTRSDVDFTEAPATYVLLEERFLMNDRYIHHFTGTLRNLKPGTTYVYFVGSPAKKQWSEEAEFTTAPDGPAPFTFVLTSDSHNSDVWGSLLVKAFERHPQTAFSMIAGDLVRTGHFRDHWDELFHYPRNIFNRRVVTPAIGNHDTQYGLGARLYLAMFGLPENGPEQIEKERTYSIEYGNAFFAFLDVTSPMEKQTEWLEKQLAQTKATWKFAVMHFPLFEIRSDYNEIHRESTQLFDKYHTDFVLSGHTHYYLRTHPMKNGKVVDSPAEGTVYLTTVSVPGRERRRGYPLPDFVAAAFGGDALYQTFDIDGNRLVMRTYNMNGDVRDELVIEK